MISWFCDGLIFNLHHKHTKDDLIFYTMSYIDVFINCFKWLFSLSNPKSRQNFYSYVSIGLAAKGENFLLQTFVFEHIHRWSAVAVTALVNIPHSFPKHTVVINCCTCTLNIGKQCCQDSAQKINPTLKLSLQINQN